MIGLLAGLALAAPASRPLADDLVYFALVDRFADGDPSNNGSIDLADPQAFHGGDLEGVRQKLDHLQGLGVRTVWLSPVFEMRTEKFHGHGAFHGYWVRDMTRIEPRFGGEAALRALAEAMKARGMRLVLDVVYNHVGFDSPLLAERPGWFHVPSPISDWNDPLQLVNGQVHGLPDLAQENDEVYHYLLGRTLYWARELDLAGLRIDAVRHLPRDFLRQLSTDLRARLGEDFWLLGEDFHGDALSLSQSFREGGFDAMFDFPLRYAMVDAFCQGRHAGRLAATLSLDRLYDDPAGLVTFLDNHDVPRILTECHGEQWRAELALAFQFTARGVPALTYGTEIPLAGAGEPANRADMRWDAPMPLAETIRALQALRREHPVLARGDTRILDLQEDQLLVMRRDEAEVAFIGVNLSDDRLQGLPRELTKGLVFTNNLMISQILAPGPRPSLESLLNPHAHGAPKPPEDPADLLFPARSVTAYFFRALDASSLPADPGEARVALEVTSAPADGERLWMVGAGPELGNWDPAKAVALKRSRRAWHGEVAVPAGVALEWKLVRQAADGSIAWEEGENRYTLLTQGDLALRTAWQAPTEVSDPR